MTHDNAYISEVLMDQFRYIFKQFVRQLFRIHKVKKDANSNDKSPKEKYFNLKKYPLFDVVYSSV